MSVNDIGSPTAPNNVRVGGGVSADQRTEAKPESQHTVSGDSSAAGRDDRVSITSAASALQQIEEQLARLPDVDTRRVTAVKQALENGSFDIDANRVAEKLIAFDTAMQRSGN